MKPRGGIRLARRAGEKSGAVGGAQIGEFDLSIDWVEILESQWSTEWGIKLVRRVGGNPRAVGRVHSRELDLSEE